MSGRIQITVVAVIVGLDQVVKSVVRDRVALHESVTVIPGFFDLTRVHNTGAAYGFLDGVDFAYKSVLLACVATAALVGLGVYAASIDRSQTLTRTGITLVIVWRVASASRLSASLRHRLRRASALTPLRTRQSWSLRDAGHVVDFDGGMTRYCSPDSIEPGAVRASRSRRW